MKILKKIITALGIGIMGLCFAQTPNPSYSTGVTQPVPSISSLSTYKNVPVSIQTGIPDISYGLFSLPTNSNGVNINLGLNYHAANVTNDQWTGDLGQGWSLMGQGVISREIVSDFDEPFSDKSVHYYTKNPFDDLYNYSIPGESGKFRFIRTVDSIKGTDTFELVNLTPTTSKIKYYRSSNDATLILDSLAITNDRGIQYKFQTYNVSIAKVWAWGRTSGNGGPQYINGNYRSAFFLTSIVDENNKELVKYSYEKETIYVPDRPTVIESLTNKLTRIESKDRGIIEFGYTKDENAPSKFDKYRLKTALLKTPTNQFVSKYTFETGLQSFSKVSADGMELEKTKFTYRNAAYSTPPGFETNPELIVPSVLTRVELPTGGTIQYDFDFIPNYSIEEKKWTTPEVDMGNVSFTKISNVIKKHFFTVPVNNGSTFPYAPYYVAVDISAGQIAGNYWSLAFYKKVGSVYQPVPINIGPAVDPDPDYPTRQLIPFLAADAGEYYVSLVSADPSITIPYGEVYFEAKHLAEPVEISTWKHSKEGLPRIKKIKYFNQEVSTVHTDSIPTKFEEYDYNFFTNPTVSSGYFVDGGTLNGIIAAAPSMIYKNVKVSNGNNTGYTKYYFKAPDAFPSQGNQFWPNYNLTRGGLAEKTEVYNDANQKLSESIFDYTIQDFNGPEYYLPGGFFQVKTVWTKEEKVTSRNFFDSGFAETKKEVVKNSNNYAPNLERVTSFDGSIQETTYQYALDKNNQKLINANIIGIPLETTSIIKKNASDNGKLMSRAETKYDNPVNKLPSSAVSYDTQNNLAEEVTFNRYDSKGNLEQYTTKEGIPVSVVWGYSKTQPIAKIEGATYDQVSTYIADIVSKSDADIDVSSEQSFQNALDLFRNNSALGNYQITTYVYDPLIGMKSMTPPSGIREMYQYDKAGRLDQIVDEKGKVLKKYKYNYKQ
ncbi:hypothetical protein [Chryseobacterium polytrichastri]|uniref:YD repeat-containing protein n=1 Tax=Chryseobacterium polytrichastri TaxID=1302687 RepID=A0A1M7FDD6_9FLAO|nr:hypothetical protein [Chryseobacterium polytrichastri]SHM01975.1 hypothetical protein SAMN05444267_103150 [Chryseobacterium polytrichastri]